MLLKTLYDMSLLTQVTARRVDRAVGRSPSRPTPHTTPGRASLPRPASESRPRAVQWGVVGSSPVGPGQSRSAASV
jgi:hypothetical protein